MSSVTRFIRQVPLSTTYYNAGTVAGSPTTLVFEFVPTSANYVGNYPPGYVQTASAALIAAIGQAVTAAGAAGNLVLRDMGKTIYAPVASLTGSAGYFRQVQLLLPAQISYSQGFIGGTSGTTFGVLGANNTPDIYTDFLTFYIPVSVAGVTGTNVITNAYALAGGQM
jgi:hypothetical protein